MDGVSLPFFIVLYIHLFRSRRSIFRNASGLRLEPFELGFRAIQTSLIFEEREDKSFHDERRHSYGMYL